MEYGRWGDLPEGVATAAQSPSPPAARHRGYGWRRVRGWSLPRTRRRRVLKRVVGDRAYWWLRLAHRLPVYRRVERSWQLRMQRRLPIGAICLDDESHIVAPDNLLCYSIFVMMTTEADCYKELQGFRRLAEGCTRMWDIGASAGYFSAVFARLCSLPAMVASVEPESKSFALLEETRRRNFRNGLDWTLFKCGVAGSDRLVRFKPASSLGTVIDEARRDGVEIPCLTLRSFGQRTGFMPDVIKIDIKSYEYEVVMSALDFLSEVKPRLHLELHSPQLRERGLDPGELLRCLDDLGYRTWGKQNGRRRKLTTLLHEYEVQRFDLSAE